MEDSIIKIYGYDDTTKKWIPIQVDSEGKIVTV